MVVFDLDVRKKKRVVGGQAAFIGDLMTKRSLLCLEKEGCGNLRANGE